MKIKVTRRRGKATSIRALKEKVNFILKILISREICIFKVIKLMKQQIVIKNV